MAVRLLLAVSTSFLLPLAAQGSPRAPAVKSLNLTFGVYSFKKPTEVYRDFMPAIEALNRSMTGTLGRPVAVSLRVFKTYDECIDAFVQGDVDFVRMGAASYVLSRQREPKIELLATEKEEIQGNMSGVIAVRSDSAIKSLADLRGRRFAFGDEKSTIGRYLSQAELVGAGIRAADLLKYSYLDRHDKVFKAVELGDFDAGALHFLTFQENNKKGQLRELLRFKNIGKPWIARAGLDAGVVAALRKVMLGMTDKPALEALQVSGFSGATDLDFDAVRSGMKKSEEFLPPAAATQPAPGKD